MLLLLSLDFLPSRDAIQKWLDHWAPAAAWGVALATALLAGATYYLARKARAEAEAMKTEVQLTTEQIAASQRPVVYPITDHTWLEDRGEGRWLAFRNGGTGVAVNVWGMIWWHSRAGENGVRLHGQTFAPQDHARLRVGESKQIDEWRGIVGYVKYEDLARQEWISTFSYDLKGGQVVAELEEVGKLEEEGEPLLPPEGWRDEELPPL